MMKKIILILMMLCIVPFVFALKAGVVVELGKTDHIGCVDVNEDATAFDVLKEFDSQNPRIEMEFNGVITNTPYLKEVNGVGEESLSGNRFAGWNFWVKEGDEFSAPPEIAPGWGAGIGDYKIKENDVIGAAHGITEFNPDWTIKEEPNPPKFYSYEELCEKMAIKDVNFRVDGKKDSGNIDVVPGSVVEVEVEVENKYGDEDLQDVYVEIEFDDFDLDDESSKEDIRNGRSKNFRFTFTIPLDAEDDDTMTITAKGESESRIEYTVSEEHDIDVKKEKHDIEIADINADSILCDNLLNIDFTLANAGKEDEDVTVRISSSELNLDESKEVNIGEAEEKEKEYSFRVSDVDEGEYSISISASYSGETVKESKKVVKRACNGEDAEEETASNERKYNVIYARPPSQEAEEFDVMPHILLGAFIVGVLAALFLLMALMKK